MNAQEIKNILIAYLKATNQEIRIYQEKSIGDAVCDLMTVTDRLTGYEIKSDLDNYRRLMKVLAEKENELRRLQMLSDNHVRMQEAHRQTIAEQEKQLTILKKSLRLPNGMPAM